MEKWEHIFLRHNEKEYGPIKDFALYSQVPSTDILYNIRTYFTIENNLISMGEKNLKEKINWNILKD
jgi:hypothetical protein